MPRGFFFNIAVRLRISFEGCADARYLGNRNTTLPRKYSKSDGFTAQATHYRQMLLKLRAGQPKLKTVEMIRLCGRLTYYVNHKITMFEFIEYVSWCRIDANFFRYMPLMVLGSPLVREHRESILGM